MWGLIMCHGVEQEDGRGGNVIQMQYTSTGYPHVVRVLGMRNTLPLSRHIYIYIYIYIYILYIYI